MQALFVDADIFTLFQNRECRCIGRRATDAEFFHALDERGFGEARWRLCEMLVGFDLALLQTIALFHRRQTAAFFILAFIIA